MYLHEILSTQSTRVMTEILTRLIFSMKQSESRKTGSRQGETRREPCTSNQPAGQLLRKHRPLVSTNRQTI